MRGVRQQQDEPGRFSICSRQAAVVLPGVQHFVAVQLNIRRPEVLSRYAERDTTLREHTALIKEYYGYHEFGDFPLRRNYR
nr:DUF4158 domain-containing protein [Escherichia coli]